MRTATADCWSLKSLFASLFGLQIKGLFLAEPALDHDTSVSGGYAEAEAV